jgi:hypothetical protein
MYSPNLLNPTKENHVSYEFIFGDGPFNMRATLIGLVGILTLPAIFVIYCVFSEKIYDPWATDHSTLAVWLIIFFIVGVVFYSRWLSIYRNGLRLGIFSKVTEPPQGKRIIEDYFPPDEEFDEKELSDRVDKFAVEFLRTMRRSKLKRPIIKYLIALSIGLYLVFDDLDISSGYFLIGSEIILFVMIFLPFHLFSKKPIELLHENPRWPQYQDLLKNYIATNKNEGE